MSVPISHGPEADCPECRDCPSCEGVGCNGKIDLILERDGVLVAVCRYCRGDGVVCPNYSPPDDGEPSEA